MSERKSPVDGAAPVGKIERHRLTAKNPSTLSPEDAKAYAEDLLQAALYGPNAYLPEGPRKPLGGLSKDPRDEDANAAGARVGRSGLQKNLEDVKNELKFLLPKVSNEDGVAQLNSIISSIQEAQNRADDYERNSVYEDPYSNQPNLYDEQKQTFDKYGLPDNDLIRKSGGSWLQGQVSHRWGPRMTLKQAVSGWRE